MSFKTEVDAVGTIAIDDGGSTTCVMTQNRKEKYWSVKALYEEKSMATKGNSKNHDFVVEYNGEKYIMGTIAKVDNLLATGMQTTSKANWFYDLSILVSVHQYGYASNYVIASTPMDMFTKDEQKSRIGRLRKSHTLTVNGVTRTFAITEFKIAPEGASAYWAMESPPEGKSRYIDIGSRTVNCASISNENGVMRYIDTESKTFFGRGIEALDKHYDPKALATYIQAWFEKSWRREDKVYLLGGGALDETLVKCIQEHYPNAEVMDDPQMVNVRGMYELGRNKYGIH